MSTLARPDQPPVPATRLWAGVLVAPIAWIVAEGVGYVLASRGCHRASPGEAANVGVVQDVLAAVLALVALTGLVIAAGNWRHVRDTASNGSPAAWGRARFMALAGVVASALFVLGIVLFALPPLLIDVCEHVR
jgi:uncharacterized membrane protein YidH (DUF202 family)